MASKQKTGASTKTVSRGVRVREKRLTKPAETTAAELKAFGATPAATLEAGADHHPASPPRGGHHRGSGGRHRLAAS